MLRPVTSPTLWKQNITVVKLQKLRKRTVTNFFHNLRLNSETELFDWVKQTTGFFKTFLLIYTILYKNASMCQIWWQYIRFSLTSYYNCLQGKFTNFETLGIALNCFQTKNRCLIRYYGNQSQAKLDCRMLRVRMAKWITLPPTDQGFKSQSRP